MTATVKPISSRSPDLFEFKSTALSLLTFIPKTRDWDTLAAQLQAKLGGNGFFSDDPVVLDFSQISPPPSAQEIAALQQLLRQYQLAPLATREGGEAAMQASHEAGLVWLPADTTHRPARQATASEAPAAPVVAVRTPAKIIDQPVRSGQQVYARDADLIVLALVSPGAEIIADGNIHVYAPLRGRALAGARGDTSARIFSTRFEAELVSVAGIYRAIDESLPASLQSRAVQVQLEGEKIMMSALSER